MPRGTKKLGTNACRMPLFPWDHTCAWAHEHPLVPSPKLLETTRSPRCEDALENWEQSHERHLCSHGTMHAHACILVLLFPALSCWRLLDLQAAKRCQNSMDKDMINASVPIGPP